jgi:hypothetical protein
MQFDLDRLVRCWTLGVPLPIDMIRNAETSQPDTQAIGSAEWRWIHWSGIFVLGVLALYAWTFYLERTAGLDSAFFSWLIIDVEVPISVLGRVGSWLPQVLPVALIRQGAPLEWVLRSYSMSLFMVHVAVYALVVYLLKDRRAGAVLPLAMVAGFHVMFYYGISELYQGLSITVLWWVVLQRAMVTDDVRSWRTPVIITVLLAVWISFYHQLLLLPIGYLMVFGFIGLGRKGRIRMIWVGAIIIAWFLVRIKTMGTSSYEQSRMPSMDDLVHYAGEWTTLNSTAYLFEVWTKFKALILLIVGGFFAGLIRKAWSYTLWSVLFSLGFLLLILIVDRNGNEPIIFENYYPILGFVWAVHLVTVLQGTTRWVSVYKRIMFVSVAFLGLLQVHQGHYLMASKLAYHQRLTTFWQQQDRYKLLVSDGNYPWDYGMGSWAMGLESALVSSLKGPQSTTTLFLTKDPALPDTITSNPRQFLGPAWSPTWFEIPNLDHRYFQLPIDTGYVHINTWASGFPYEQLELRAPVKPYRFGPDRLCVVPIVIHNPSSALMPSRTDAVTPVRMTYRLFHPDGTELEHVPLITGLETDIPPGMSYEQGLIIKRPDRPGRYWVIADLVVDGKTFGKYATFDLIVDRWPF